MLYSFQVGLILKSGSNLLQLTRVFDDGTVLLEDTKTRKPLTLHRDEVVERVNTGKFKVVVGEASSPNTKNDQEVLVDLNSLDPRERKKLAERFDFVRAMQKKGVRRGQRQKVALHIPAITQALGLSKEPSTSTVMSWMRSYQTSSCNIAALVSKNRFRKRKIRLSSQLNAVLWKVLRREYFTRDKHSIQHAYTQLHAEIKREIAKGTLTEGEQVSYLTLTRRIKEVDLYHRIATREGPARARMVCRTSFPDGYPNYPLERVEIDHTPLNWVVICDRTGLPLGRPLLTLIIDAYSGYVLGFYISFYGPGVTSVSGALRNLLESKREITVEAGLKNEWLSHGLADELVVDNGLEFHSFAFKQMAMCLGVDLMFCRVRTPWLKPHVERFFATLNTLTLAKGKITKHMANVLRIDPYKDACITFSDLVTGLLKFIVDVHPFEPNWRKMARPYDLFLEGIERCPPAQFSGNMEELKRASGMSKVLTLGPGGIEMMGLPYGSYGFKDIANKHGTRIKVLCKWDPDDLSTLYVQPPQSRDWITAQCRWQEYSNGL
ncbi:hypothetical protein P3G55_19385, partial [Leptospira sp. 96542]|nr:hypothetical protein [Leptospira sp. 96542]